MVAVIIIKSNNKLWFSSSKLSYVLCFTNQVLHFALAIWQRRPPLSGHSLFIIQNSYPPAQLFLKHAKVWWLSDNDTPVPDKKSLTLNTPRTAEDLVTTACQKMGREMGWKLLVTEHHTLRSLSPPYIWMVASLQFNSIPDVTSLKCFLLHHISSDGLSHGRNGSRGLGPQLET